MKIKPMIRNNICLSSHPAGCVKSVENQIEYIKTLAPLAGAGAPKLALVIGCSMGYGLATRIALAFGCGAATIGLSMEKPGTATKTGSPGFYNNLAFDRAAAKEKLFSRSIDGDAFSNETKNACINAAKEASAALGTKIDLVIYSLASPVRLDPKTGILHKSVIKPIGSPYSGETIDIVTGELSNINIAPATDEEIAATVKVMGGEDWELWMEALCNAGLLAENFRTVAFTYIGPESSWPIYKNGTIGRAKADLERAFRAINKKFSRQCAWVSVNKAVVTRASAVIPIIPYISALFKVMKAKKTHEGCIEQAARLLSQKLYSGEAAHNADMVPVDDEHRIRLDEFELRPDVQEETAKEISYGLEKLDVSFFKHDFLEAHGFDIAGVDYEAEQNTAGI
ncbi:MAG: trans-2-enoyl-CoA reductase family protein [Spirochaetaceae bacterium]|jgi:enoyl-[acyl-carrier protein] reductase/trans-2-enoyl-CoA reductase (NAD+)|nr:trans-2-enoyl-CoA reductase family protein [Spirochaetaceae bacterium]